MPKRFFITFLSVILLSACSFQSVTLTPPPQPAQPTPLNAQESNATATSTPLVLLPTYALPTSTAIASCPDAPLPHIMLGQQVTVMVEDFDKLRLHEIPDASPTTALKELPQFTQLKVLEGPVCVPSTDAQGQYLFWKVQVVPSGEIGWVAEGDSLHYFVEAPTPQPTMTVVVQLPTALTCPGAPTTHISVGQKVTVITEDYDKLKLRSDPSFSSEYAKELAKFTQLKVLDGPMCIASTEPGVSYLFWKVEVLDTTGTTGWIAEGNAFYYFVQ
jgi:hypothetical protein